MVRWQMLEDLTVTIKLNLSIIFLFLKKSAHLHSACKHLFISEFSCEHMLCR